MPNPILKLKSTIVWLGEDSQSKTKFKMIMIQQICKFVQHSGLKMEKNITILWPNRLLHLAGALMEHIIEGIPPLRH